jgi:hypothetical protein
MLLKLMLMPRGSRRREQINHQPSTMQLATGLVAAVQS